MPENDWNPRRYVSHEHREFVPSTDAPPPACFQKHVDNMRDLDNLLACDGRAAHDARIAARRTRAMRRRKCLKFAWRYIDYGLFLPPIAVIVLAAWLTGWLSGAVGVVGWSWFLLAALASVAVTEES